ncbi:LysR family transcriptional regulator [Patulibacter defluvii]|uniref:LysR family transcriptional regulator n=1 Tax=Patulibacter defluvii TaxID=3095358 RepID=UPI002A755FFF|nr:LysR family transcriptional regulator [Patulibacter sp. DM4]
MVFAIRQLEALVAVAETGHLGRAGERLGTTTSSISGLLSRLEREVGVPLLRRSQRPVTLTAEGVAVLDQARVVVAAGRRLAARVRAVAEGRGGVVRVGVDRTCRPEGEAVARELRAGLPGGWSVRTEVAVAAEVGERFERGAVDLMVTRQPLARRAREWWRKPWERPRRARSAVALVPLASAVSRAPPQFVWTPGRLPPLERWPLGPGGLVHVVRRRAAPARPNQISGRRRPRSTTRRRPGGGAGRG